MKLIPLKSWRQTGWIILIISFICTVFVTLFVKHPFEVQWEMTGKATGFS